MIIDESKAATWAIVILAVSAIAVWLFLFSFSGTVRNIFYPTDFSKEEIDLVNNSDYVMHVFTINDSSELKHLRQPSRDLSEDALRSDTFKKLASYMLATANAPEYRWLGLSAPQVGISRRLIVVKRLDKAGDPYELYANVKIDSLYGRICYFEESSASTPMYKGLVPRFDHVKVSYIDQNTFLPMKETVSGYSAFVFQHDCDLLDGILISDKADPFFIDQTLDSSYEFYLSHRRYKVPDN